MTSTTIRYSTLPENSQSISFASAYRTPGGPDPDSPGAYRYDPDTYDPSIPDSDPRSPRYEPPHLRHQPGDTFEIGGKPHDPLDPGPFGSPGWRPDNRTGRHRRGELPDPPPEEVITPTWQRRPRRAQPQPDPEPVEDQSPPVRDSPPSPYRRYRRWGDATEESTNRHSNRHTTPRAEHSTDEEPYRFSPMREGAMQRFLEISQPFRNAHFEPDPPTLAARLIWALRWLLWVVACGLAPQPGPLVVPPKPAPATSSASTGGTHRTHWTEAPKQARPPTQTPSQMPYIAAWERRFDAQFQIAGGGVL